MRDPLKRAVCCHVAVTVLLWLALILAVAGWLLSYRIHSSDGKTVCGAVAALCAWLLAKRA